MKNQFAKASNIFIGISILLFVFGCKAFTKTNDTKSIDTAQSNRTKGNLADDIIGSWSGNWGRDKVTLTFKKDGTVVSKEEEKLPDNGTYTIIDDETIEMKAPNRPTMRPKVKITGDVMQFKPGRETLTLKRVN